MDAKNAIKKRRPQSNEIRSNIIAAALSLLDAEGLSELSLRKLAAKVDLKAPALYWYFTNKESLIDYLAEAILLEEFSDLNAKKSDQAWDDWLIKLCIRLRRAMLSRRDGARIVAGAHLQPAVTLARIMEVASESLESAGITEEKADLIIGTAIHFTFGRVIEEQSSPTIEEINALDVDYFITHYPRLGRNIKRIQASGNVTGYSNESFEDSLRLIVRL